MSLFLISVCSFSEGIQNPIKLGPFSLADSAINTSGIGLEIYKVGSNRKYKLYKNKLVRVFCLTQNGQMRLMPARITEITSNQITFTPTSNKFNETTHSELTLNYIQFTTTEAILRGMIVNVVIISVRVLLAGYGVMESMVIRSSSDFKIGGSHWPKFDDFRKHIQFYKLNGDQKWGIRIIKESL